ncbi:MAG: enoyl-CoA hydratase-related protein [Eubacteriales bacterium]|nr:enoyl-CoA hydratase-related protein [Eubacteriales bacterium]
MDFVLYQTQDNIGVITINRPSALNALNMQLLNELNAALDLVDTANVRALIITGAGEKAFVAGADIAQMRDMSRKQAEEFSALGNDLFSRIAKFPIPVIAAVNGYALGGGCELALSADICICSQNAMFGQPETSLGIIPGFGGTQRLERKIGAGRAKEMIYSCISIDAQTAERYGLVNHVYPCAELMDEAMKLAAKISKNAPIAVRNAKKAINEGHDMPMDEAIRVEQDAFAACFETHDQAEGMQAFLERRKEKNFTNN